MLENTKSGLIMKQRAAIDFCLRGKSPMEMNDLIQ